MKRGRQLQDRRNTDINKPGNIGYVLREHADELNKITSKGDLIAFMDRIAPEIDTDLEYVASVREDVKKQPFLASFRQLYDIVLKGEGLSLSYLH